MSTYRRSMIGLALATAVVGAASAGAWAQEVSSNNLRQNLFSTCFVSESEGWAVGDLGRIFHTTDGGKNWERQTAGTKHPFSSITCPDKDHIWVAGQAGQIAFSGDGGKTWTMQKSGTERHLLDIAFVNAQLGIVVGDFGLMLRTEDGGNTWVKQAMPKDVVLPEDVAEVVDPGDVVLYSLTFSDADHWWVAGEFGVVIHSENGGLEWHGQTSGSENSLFGIYFADNQHGWAVGMEATFITTADGGQTWTKKEVETPKGFSLALYDVQVKGNYGWAVGNSGYVLQTSDGGNTWKLVTVPKEMASFWLRTIALRGDGGGYIVGARGLVLALEKDHFTALKEKF